MKRRIKLLVTAVVLLVLPLLSAAPAFALGGQIDGTIYNDQNNNGQQDSGEPGVPDILVSYGYGSGQKTALTDSSGHYAITAVTGTGRVSVDTGWFRSACNSLNCTVGTAGGNDFTVANQYITLSGVNGSAGATLNTGLVPAWSGTYPIPASPTSAATDIAARLTYNSGCSTDGVRLCTASTPTKLYVNLLNQGTAALSNPQFVLELPPGHSVNDASWTDPKDVFTVAYPTANTITTLQSFNTIKDYGVYQLNGTIPAGAASAMAFTMNISSNATSSATPYATTDPFDKQAEVRVIHMDQTGDPDTTLCEANGADWRTGTCAISQLGVHDKTKALDASDAAGWNVSTSTASTMPGYDPASSLGLAGGQSGTVAAGDLVQFAVTVANNGTGDAGVRNVKVTDTVPADMTFSASDNPGWTLVSGVPTTYVTAQVAPGDSLTVPIALRIGSSVTTADNGTAALTNQTQISSFQKNWPSASGVFPAGTDSNSSNNSGTQAVFIGDTVPPTVPTGLSTTVTSTNSINLSWTSSTDNVGVTGYHVFRNGSDVATVTGTTYADTGLSSNTAYNYTVQAVDAAGNYSTASSTASATTWTQFVGNSGVETDLTGWTDLWGPATTTLSRISSEAHSGSYSLRTDTSSTGGTSAGFTNYTTAHRWVTSTVNAKTYTASAWVKTSMTGMSICVRQTEYSSAGTNLGNTETCTPSSSTSTWFQVTNTKTALANGDSMTTSVYCTFMKNDRYFLADDFSIVAP